MTAFGGFPPETIRFLRQLSANNRKDWFDAHRSDYEAFWVAPAKAFVVAAGRQLAELAPGIRAEHEYWARSSASTATPASAATSAPTRTTSTSGSGRGSGAAPSAASSPA
jgi:Conserved hypothetical protein (DUF2461)